MNKKPRDWTGYIVVIPEQHSLIITGQWKDRPDMWWWKCKDCFESAGVMSLTQLEKLNKKGMIAEPDGEGLPSKWSKHPDETDSLYEAYYSYD